MSNSGPHHWQGIRLDGGNPTARVAFGRQQSATELSRQKFDQKQGLVDKIIALLRSRGQAEDRVRGTLVGRNLSVQRLKELLEFAEADEVSFQAMQRAQAGRKAS